MSKWYCHECKTEFTSNNANPVCPNGHSLGKWTEIIPKTNSCKICGLKLDASYRERLDRKSPNGSVIKRPENNGAILSHFATYHPSLLRKSAKELGIGISINAK